MAKRFEIRTDGLDKLLKKLGPKGQKDLLGEVSSEFEIKANDIRNEAVSRVSVDQGFLRNSIKTDGKDLTWMIDVTADYASYQEFGTKTLANVPSELRDLAVSVNTGKSSYKSFKQAIFEWIKRKGIPEQALWPIMAKIMNVGVHPRPFMGPAIKKIEPTIQKDIDKVIQRWLDK
jgi:phage protein, HK97 gp10 family